VRFALIDATGGATTSDGSRLNPAILHDMAAILTIYANRDVAQEYGGSHVIRGADSPGDIADGEIPFSLLANLADAPGAIAYHNVDGQGAPDCFDGITLSDTIMGPGNSLLCALSHEVAETIADEGCNLIATGIDGRGYAREACDPVESNSYTIGLAIGTIGHVSDFVLRSYFIPSHPGPWSFMASRGLGGSAPPGPLQVAAAGGGNYQIVYAGIGAEAQVTGMVARRMKRMHPTSRTYRRGARV
jgi:hypothetical protein